MNYAKIIYFDTGNAPGLSTVLFVSGCENYCDGCHNKETWDFNYGKPFTDKEEEEIIKSLDNPHIKNLVITGGDPCHPRNIETIIDLCRKVREKYPIINIIVYTGYTLEELNEREDNSTELFCLINFLIDGKFDKNKPTKQLDYRGSTNQRCIGVTHTSIGEPVFMDCSSYYFKENLDKKEL